MQYIQNLAKADEKAADLITDYLREHEILSDKGFNAFADYFYAVVTKYAEGASEMAAQAYETLADVQGAVIKSAMPAETPSYGECMKTIRGTMLDSDQAKSLGQAAGRLVRRTGVDTTINNALRDGAEWAWVPSGDTCAFCMMLASNGWQRASKKALKNGHASHIHANCDCTYAIRFDGKSTVEGYDPDFYKAMYDNAEGDTWKDKLNSMRRERYAVNKDKINAQKRAAYSAHKTYELMKKGQKPVMTSAEKDDGDGLIRIREFKNDKSNFNQVEYEEKVLDALEVDRSEVSTETEPMSSGRNGYCQWSSATTKDEILIDKCVLNSDDWRSDDYKKKTAWHEGFHAKNNHKKWDGFDNYTMNPKWEDIEETMTEAAANYLVREAGVKRELQPSYADKLVRNLPKMKRESSGAFKDCESIYDFGRVAYKQRMTANESMWLQYADELGKIALPDDYYKVYEDYVDEHVPEAVKKIAESVKGVDKIERTYRTRIHDALWKKEKGEALSPKEEQAYNHAILWAMQKLGVK